jgi:hypothetical protein
MTIDTQQLEAALSFANYQSTLANQRRLLKEKFESDCLLAYMGGLFKITQGWLGSFDTSAAWQLDHNSNPIKIDNPQDLLEQARTAYNQALAAYGEAYQQLRVQRNVTRLTEL